MIARFRGRLIGGSAVAALALAGVALAQVQTQPLPGQQRPQAGRPAAQTNKTDMQIAAWLIVDNHGEVAVSRLAQQRAKSDDVKKFAAKMVEDHTQFVDKLQQFAGPHGGALQGQAGAQPGREQGGQPGAQPGRALGGQAGIPADRGGMGGLDIVEVKQRLGQKCLESVRSELEKKDGAEFDQCYASQQAMMHMVMLDTMEVFRNYASPQLRQVLEEGIQTTEEHLKTAKDLAETTTEHREVARRGDGESRKE